MLTPALRLDMARYFTSMAYYLAHPIVALPLVAFFTIEVSSSTFLRYKYCGIWSQTTGPAEASFEGQEVGNNGRHCVRFLTELEGGCKGSPFFSMWDVGHDVEFPPTVFDGDIAYRNVIDYLVLD
jgi:hypothetical protein